MVAVQVAMVAVMVAMAQIIATFVVDRCDPTLQANVQKHRYANVLQNATTISLHQLFLLQLSEPLFSQTSLLEVVPASLG